MNRKQIAMITMTLAALAAGDLCAQGPDGGRRFRGPGGPFGQGGPDGGPGGPEFMDRMLRSFPLMAALDADEDGEISSSEIEGAVAALKGLDKNQDGKLNSDELRPERGSFGPGGPGGRGRDPEAMLSRIMESDKDGDGKLSKEELPERMQNLIARADDDNDGSLSKDELEKAFAEMGGGRAGRGGRGGGAPRNTRPQRPE